MEYVQMIEGILTVPMLANGGADIDNAIDFGYGYGSNELCELHSEGDCSEDGVLWSVMDFGSPSFCTSHYFPQEQLGYEFIEGSL